MYYDLLDGCIRHVMFEDGLLCKAFHGANGYTHYLASIHMLSLDAFSLHPLGQLDWACIDFGLGTKL